MKKYFILLLVIFLFSSCSSILYSGSKNKFYLQKKDFTWRVLRAKNFIAYYQPGSKAEKNLSLVETKIVKGIVMAKKFTGIDSIKTPVYYFIVNDKNDFYKLTGLNHTAISFAKSNTIIESYFLLGEAHEVVHLLTHQNWRNTHTWIAEGLAVYSDNTWNNQSLDLLCYNLLENEELIPLKNLFKNNKLNTFNSQISYPQSGSVVKYLITNYGWDTFKKFWKNPNCKLIYHISENDLENQWIKYLKSQHKN